MAKIHKETRTPKELLDRIEFLKAQTLKDVSLKDVLDIFGFLTMTQTGEKMIDGLSELKARVPFDLYDYAIGNLTQSLLFTLFASFGSKEAKEEMCKKYPEYKRFLLGDA